MKKILFIVAFCLLASSASAQVYTKSVVKQRLVGLGMESSLAAEVGDLVTYKAPLPNATPLVSLNAAGTANLSLIRGNALDNTEVNAATGKEVLVSVANTPYARFATSSLYPDVSNSLALGYSSKFWNGLWLGANSDVSRAVFVPTMAATPVAATNDFKLGLNVVPTAAANTAALMPTPVTAGQRLTIVNNSGAAVRIKAGGTNTINGSAGGAYIPLAVAAIADCTASTTTNWYCSTGAVPTPAGP